MFLIDKGANKTNYFFCFPVSAFRSNLYQSYYALRGPPNSKRLKTHKSLLASRTFSFFAKIHPITFHQFLFRAVSNYPVPHPSPSPPSRHFLRLAG